MNLEQLINLDRIDCQVAVSSKKKGLEELSELISIGHPNLTVHEVFENLISREKLGSTGIGHGVAIPHGRCPYVSQAVGAFIQLSGAVDYDSADKQPVDLLFALLVPENSTDEHLEVLSQLAKVLRDPEIREKLRHAPDKETVFTILKEAWTTH